MTLERCPLQAEAAREFLENSGAKHRIRVNRDLLASSFVCFRLFSFIFVWFPVSVVNIVTTRSKNYSLSRFARRFSSVSGCSFWEH